MAKTPTDKEVRSLSDQIVRFVEPKIEAIIKTFNSFIAKDKLRVACEIKWAFEKVEDEESKKEN